MVSVVLAVFGLVAFIGQSASEQIPFRPCKDHNPLKSLDITPCNSTVINGWETCVLSHGDIVSIYGDFVSPFNSSHLQMLTMVTLNGIEVPTPSSVWNLCYGYISPDCPVGPGKQHLFKRYYSVRLEFPVGSTALKFIIRDWETRKRAACAKIPIVVQPNPYGYYFKSDLETI